MARSCWRPKPESIGSTRRSIASAATSCWKVRPDDPAPAEQAFLAAIAVAREQGARSFCLQAALKLAKLYQSTGRLADAHAVLAPVLGGFSPTPELPEIAEAHALLDTLAKDDRVRDALGRQQDP